MYAGSPACVIRSIVNDDSMRSREQLPSVRVVTLAEPHASGLAARHPVQALLHRHRREDPLSDDIPGEILEHHLFSGLAHFSRQLGMLQNREKRMRQRRRILFLYQQSHLLMYHGIEDSLDVRRDDGTACTHGFDET